MTRARFAQLNPGDQIIGPANVRLEVAHRYTDGVVICFDPAFPTDSGRLINPGAADLFEPVEEGSTP